MINFYFLAYQLLLSLSLECFLPYGAHSRVNEKHHQHKTVTLILVLHAGHAGLGKSRNWRFWCNLDAAVLIRLLKVMQVKELGFMQSNLPENFGLGVKHAVGLGQELGPERRLDSRCRENFGIGLVGEKFGG